MYRCPLPRPGQGTNKAHFNLHGSSQSILKRSRVKAIFFFYVKRTGQFI